MQSHRDATQMLADINDLFTHRTNIPYTKYARHSTERPGITYTGAVTLFLIFSLPVLYYLSVILLIKLHLSQKKAASAAKLAIKSDPTKPSKKNKLISTTKKEEKQNSIEEIQNIEYQASDDQLDLDSSGENITYKNNATQKKSPPKKLSRTKRVMASSEQHQKLAVNLPAPIHPVPLKKVQSNLTNASTHEFCNKPGTFFYFNTALLKTLEENMPDKMSEIGNVIETAKTIGGTGDNKKQHGFFIRESTGKIKVKLSGKLRLYGERVDDKKNIYEINQYTKKHKQSENPITFSPQTALAIKKA